MPSLREKIAIAISGALVATGVVTALQPPSPTSQEERDRAKLRREIDNLGDAQEQQQQRNRDAGETQAESERRRRLVSGEHRPPEPHVRIRLVP